MLQRRPAAAELISQLARLHKSEQATLLRSRHLPIQRLPLPRGRESLAGNPSWAFQVNLPLCLTCGEINIWAVLFVPSTTSSLP